MSSCIVKEVRQKNHPVENGNSAHILMYLSLPTKKETKNWIIINNIDGLWLVVIIK